MGSGIIMIGPLGVVELILSCSFIGNGISFKYQDKLNLGTDAEELKTALDLGRFLIGDALRDFFNISAFEYEIWRVWICS